MSSPVPNRNHGVSPSPPPNSLSRLASGIRDLAEAIGVLAGSLVALAAAVAEIVHLL
jgi:hypothetical protein